MPQRRCLPSYVFLILLACALLSCGLSHNQLKSLTITPASAAAKDYPNGKVQFTAVGTYINGSQVRPVTSLWTPGPPWSLTPQIPWPPLQLDSTGLASCGTVGPGLYAIYATAPANPDVPLAKMTMTTPQVAAMASLTCP